MLSFKVFGGVFAFRVFSWPLSVLLGYFVWLGCLATFLACILKLSNRNMQARYETEAHHKAQHHQTHSYKSHGSICFTYTSTQQMPNVLIYLGAKHLDFPKAEIDSRHLNIYTRTGRNTLHKSLFLPMVYKRRSINIYRCLAQI